MIRLIIYALLLVPVVAGATLILTDEEQAFLDAHPVIRLSVCDDAQPFEFLDDGVPRGFDIDYLKLIEERLGVRFEFVTGMTWNEFEQALENREIDILNGAPPAEKYKAYGLFSDPFIYFQRVYITQKGAPAISSPDDLKGLTVSAMKGMGYLDVWREKYPEIDFLMVDALEEVIMAVALGKADATLIMEQSYEYYKKRNTLSNLQISGVDKRDAGLDNSFLYVVRKDWPELPAILNKAMQDIPKEEKHALWRKWFNWGSDNPRTIFSEKDWQYVDSTRALRYGILSKAAPIEFVDPHGNCAGLTVDYMKIFSAQTGIPVECIPVDTRKEKLDLLVSGRCDLLATYATYDLPSGRFLTSEPYMVFNHVIATRVDVPYIDNLAACAGETVALVPRIGLLEEYRKQYPSVNFVQCNSLHEGLYDLSQGDVYGVIGPRPVIAHQIQELYLGNLKIAGTLEHDLKLAAIVKKDNEPLLNVLTKVIESITPEEQRNLLNQWVSIRFEQGFDYRLFWKLIAGVGGVALVLGALFVITTRYNRKLRTLNELQAETLRERDRIMSVISHDMRQPIYGYNRFLSLLQNGSIDTTTKDGQRLLVEARSRGENAIECMENLLRWLANTRGVRTGVHTSVSPAYIVDDCCELLDASLQNRIITVNNNIDSEIRIETDEIRLATVIRNLINNAIRFSHGGGVVDVSAELGKDSLRIRVSDSGVGMDAETIERIKGGNLKCGSKGVAGEQGTGLGLSLCKRLLEEMDAEWQIESKPGEGTAVTVTLAL